MMGSAKPASLPSRFKAAARKLDVWSSKKRMNCLGYIPRERGHRRVPEPPESITGKIAPMGAGLALRTRSISSARPLAQGAGRLSCQHDEETGERAHLTFRHSPKRCARSLPYGFKSPAACQRLLSRTSKGGTGQNRCIGGPYGGRERLEGCFGGDGILGGQPGRGRCGGGDPVALRDKGPAGAWGGKLRHPPLARRAREVLLL